MKMYTISQLEEFSEEERKNILDERSKMAVRLVSNILTKQKIEGFFKSEDNIELTIERVDFVESDGVYETDTLIMCSVNIYLKEYSDKFKKKHGSLYQNSLIQNGITHLLEKAINKESTVMWSNKKKQGKDFINMHLYMSNKLVIPDLLIYEKYEEDLTKKIELEEKLILELNELNYEKFNIIKEEHCYVPTDKEELTKYIDKAKKSFNFDSLNAVVKKHPDNEEIVLSCLKSLSEDSFEFASDRLKNDDKFIHRAINEHSLYNFLVFAHQRFLDDDSIMKPILSKSGYMMRAASERIRNNKEICLLAVASQAQAYQFISEEMKKDRDILNKTVESDGVYLISSPEIKTNKELLIKAFSTTKMSSYYLLQETSEIFKNDKEVAVAALSKDENNYQYLGDELKLEIGENHPLTYIKKCLLEEVLNNDESNKNKSNKPKLKI